MRKRIFSCVTGFLATLCLLITCTPKPLFFRSNYTETNTFIHQREQLREEQFFKAHLRNGAVHIFRELWSVDTIQNLVTGRGSSYGYNRKKIGEGLISIAIDSVAIFETNSKLEGTETNRIRALAILAGVDAAIGVFCLTTPKARLARAPHFILTKKTISTMPMQKVFPTPFHPRCSTSLFQLRFNEL